MNSRVHIAKKACALLLAGCLCLFGVPAAPLVVASAFADETDEPTEQESSSSKIKKDPTKDTAETQPTTEPEPANPEPEKVSDPEPTPDPDPVPEPEPKPEPEPAPEPEPEPKPESEALDTSKETDENKNSSASETADANEGANESSSSSTPPREDADGNASRNGLSTETEDSEAAVQARDVEEAQAAYDNAYAAAAEAAGQLDAMEELQANLNYYFDLLAQSSEEINAIVDSREPLVAQRGERETELTALKKDLKDAQAVRAEAIYGLLLVDQELFQAGGEGVLSVILGVGNATDADNYEYLLERMAKSHVQNKEEADKKVAKAEANIAEKEGQISELDDAIKEVDSEKSDAQVALEALVAEGNEAAFAIEKLASETRQASREAATVVEKLNDEIAGVVDLKQDAATWDLASNSVRAQALDLAGAWYDAVDAIAGLEDGISYGCGLDFALEEKDFVAKWGPAIDSFFDSQGAPLKGYGNEMARQAYTYKVDPRLCAAVSIVESSGGHYCIKPHNAWGWGAADSDPYNLASGWSSWEEAIEAWHKGMATSQTGLATTPSLTGMGDIYCSTPIWGSKVATLMEQISSHVETQQLVVRS